MSKPIVSRPITSKPIAVNARVSTTLYQRFRNNPLAFLAKKLYAWRMPSLAAATIANPLRVVCISDTHDQQPELPDGDLLLHAGDLTGNGSYAALQAQINWLNKQTHLHKVVIAGKSSIGTLALGLNLIACLKGIMISSLTKLSPADFQNAFLCDLDASAEILSGARSSIFKANRQLLIFRMAVGSRYMALLGRRSSGTGLSNIPQFETFFRVRSPQTSISSSRMDRLSIISICWMQGVARTY